MKAALSDVFRYNIAHADAANHGCTNHSIHNDAA